ncbi:MAG: GTP 3',8-cyclase MoaA [Solirubrobacteraceae bacterium]|jgi:cyclic pyranopterin phosphate synthase
MDAARDRLGRPALDLRISVTDRCNLRCPYCMPREVFGRDFQFVDRAELLSFEEIARVTRIMSELGVTKVRLTGGEPLLRRGLERLVEMLAGINAIEDLAMTTNGTLLARRCETLAKAGLGRVTVSLDALEERAFRSMSDTRVPLARVLEGIESAQAAGLGPVKINMVVRRGVNDHCVLAMAEHFRGRPQILRFIEYMDVGETNGWKLGEVVPGSEILAAIDSRWPLQPLSPNRSGEVASRWAYRDGAGEIGVIRSVTEPFCQGCARARLSADGSLYTCLFASSGFDLRALLRAGAGDGDIAAQLRELWTARADRYSELRGMSEPSVDAGQSTHDDIAHERPRVEMSYIGG